MQVICLVGEYKLILRLPYTRYITCVHYMNYTLSLIAIIYAVNEKAENSCADLGRGGDVHCKITENMPRTPWKTQLSLEPP